MCFRARGHACDSYLITTIDVGKAPYGCSLPFRGGRHAAQRRAAKSVPTVCPYAVQFAYVTGASRPVSMKIGIFGMGVVVDEKVEATTERGFDLRRGTIIRDVDLCRPSSRGPRLTEFSVARRSNSLESV